MIKFLHESPATEPYRRSEGIEETERYNFTEMLGQQDVIRDRVQEIESRIVDMSYDRERNSAQIESCQEELARLAIELAESEIALGGVVGARDTKEFIAD